jgi:hypothetical protein
MIVHCYFYTLANYLIDTTVSHSVTIKTNAYPIRTLIRVASILVGRRSRWALGPGKHLWHRH